MLVDIYQQTGKEGVGKKHYVQRREGDHCGLEWPRKASRGRNFLNKASKDRSRLEWACIPGSQDPGIDGMCERPRSPKGQRGSLGEESIVPGVDEGYRNQLQRTQ